MSPVAHTIGARIIRSIGGRRGVLAFVVLSLGAGTSVALAASQNGVVRPVYEPARPTVKLGQELFDANCASCHGIVGQGIPRPRPGAGDITGAGPSLRGVGALGADFYLRSGFMPLANIHAEPSNQRVFSNKEIEAITAFVAALGPGPALPHPEPSSASLARGLKAFTEDCAGCHQSLARGGFVTGARVPPLQGIDAREIAEAVRIGPYLMPRFSARQIPNSQLNSIIKYVLWTNHPLNRGGWSIGNLGPIPEGMIAWLAALLLAVACLAVSRRLRA
ncbi:MAG: c-type cytochrome [Solirubrobacteraceae bacterium]